ncbi:MAG TPA: imelysin family protein [Polyangia bacterium]|nr:imelysin family protein [Polyangia bacterium]
MKKQLGLAATLIAAVAAVSLPACGGSSASQQDSVARAMQQSLLARLTTLWTSAQAIQTAAPAPAGRGWDKDMDADALASMKTAWVAARSAYEHVEGATAPVYPDLDISLDERYDGFLAALGPQGDSDLFDGQGVTGMHAIERILYADVTPAAVVTFEKTLPGYVAAAWPATEAQAAEFKNGLCARLVTDAKTLLDGWTPAKIDVSGAFQGLIGLVNEQQEKVNKAATGEEESRYSQHTMLDLRDNLDGTTVIYDLFQPWLDSKPASGDIPAGSMVDASITSGLAGLGTIYGTVQGDAIPQPPATWSAEMPSDADLATPFGMLYEQVHAAVDPSKPDSIVSHMNEGAQLLGIPGFAP